jgi:hypothetical protein
VETSGAFSFGKRVAIEPPPRVATLPVDLYPRNDQRTDNIVPLGESMTVIAHDRRRIGIALGLALCCASAGCNRDAPRDKPSHDSPVRDICSAAPGNEADLAKRTANTQDLAISHTWNEREKAVIEQCLQQMPDHIFGGRDMRPFRVSSKDADTFFYFQPMFPTDLIVVIALSGEKVTGTYAKSGL